MTSTVGRRPRTLALTAYDRLVLFVGLHLACLVIWAVEKAPRQWQRCGRTMA